jgi:hypothetical protein
MCPSLSSSLYIILGILIVSSLSFYFSLSLPFFFLSLSLSPSPLFPVSLFFLSLSFSCLSLFPVKKFPVAEIPCLVTSHFLSRWKAHHILPAQKHLI